MAAGLVRTPEVEEEQFFEWLGRREAAGLASALQSCHSSEECYELLFPGKPSMNEAQRADRLLACAEAFERAARHVRYLLNPDD